MKVKSLLVKIGADTTKFQTGLKKSQGLMKKHAAQFRKIGRGAAIAGAAVAGAVALMIRNYVRAGDEVHKMAKRTGFSTEALSELRYAADICGADIRALEKGVKRMAKTITDAAEGMTTYLRAFKRIGIEVEELQGLKPEEQFDRIARAIANVEDATIRAATAQDIFGRAGTQLLPLFAEGEKGLEALRKKAHELGIVFDQEAANKAARLKDAQTSLKAAFQGLSFTIADTLIPTITSLVENFTDAIVDMKSSAKGLASSLLEFFKIILQGIQGLILAFDILKFSIFSLGRWITKSGKKSLTWIQKLWKESEKIAPITKNQMIWYKRLEKVIENMTVVEKGYYEEKEKLINQMANLIEIFDGLFSALENVKTGLDGGKEKIKKIGETITKTAIPAMRDLSGVLEKVQSEFKELTGNIKENSEEFKGIFVRIFSQMAYAVGNFFTQIGNLSRTNYQNQINKISAEYEARRKAIEDSIMDEEEKAKALEKIDAQYEARKKAVQKKAFESQKKISLVTAAINIAEAITRALTGAIPPWNMILAGITAAAGAIQLAAIQAQTFPGFAKGGRIKEAGIVGEKGPELFLPDRPGTIVPLRGAELAMSGAQFHTTVNIYAQKLDDYTINHAAEKIFRAMEIEKRRRGF